MSRPSTSLPRTAAALAALAALVACGDPTIEVTVPFATVYVTPNDGSLVPAAESAGLTLFAAFNADLDAGSVGGVTLERTAPDAAPITVTASASGSELTVDHGPLAAGSYAFVIPGSVKSAEGDELAYDVRVDFEVTE